MDQEIIKSKRSQIMSRVKSKDTSIEIKVRKYLFSKGLRYRKNVRCLPGTPDIVLKKYRTVIFVHGCFWHRHANCKYTSTPKSNAEYWNKKFDRNISNDTRHYEELTNLGWHVIVIWECEVKKNFEINMKRVINDLDSYYLQEKYHFMEQESI